MTHEQRQRYHELCDKIFNSPDDTNDAKEFWSLLEVIQSDLSKERRSSRFFFFMTLAAISIGYIILAFR